MSVADVDIEAIKEYDENGRLIPPDSSPVKEYDENGKLIADDTENTGNTGNETIEHGGLPDLVATHQTKAWNHFSRSFRTLNQLQAKQKPDGSIPKPVNPSKARDIAKDIALDFKSDVQFLDESQRDVLRNAISKSDLPFETKRNLAYVMRQDVTPSISQEDVEKADKKDYNYPPSEGLESGVTATRRQSLLGIASDAYDLLAGLPKRALNASVAELAGEDGIKVETERFKKNLDRVVDDFLNLGIVPITTERDQIRSALGVEEDLSGAITKDVVKLPALITEIVMTKGLTGRAGSPNLGSVAKTSKLVTKLGNFAGNILKKAASEGTTFAASQALFKGQTGEKELESNLKAGYAFGAGSELFNKTFTTLFYKQMLGMEGMTAPKVNALIKMTGDAIVGTAISAGLDDKNVLDMSLEEWVKHGVPQIAMSALHVKGMRGKFADEVTNEAVRRGQIRSEDVGFVRNAILESMSNESVVETIAKTKKTLAKARGLEKLVAADFDMNSEHPAGELNKILFEIETEAPSVKRAQEFDDLLSQIDKEASAVKDFPKGLTYRQFVERLGYEWDPTAGSEMHSKVASDWEAYKSGTFKPPGETTELTGKEGIENVEAAKGTGAEAQSQATKTKQEKPGPPVPDNAAENTDKAIEFLMRDTKDIDFNELQSVMGSIENNTGAARKLFEHYKKLPPIDYEKDPEGYGRHNRFRGAIEKAIGEKTVEEVTGYKVIPVEDFAQTVDEILKQKELQKITDPDVPEDGGPNIREGVIDGNGNLRERAFIETVEKSPVTSHELAAVGKTLDRFYEVMNRAETMLKSEGAVRASESGVLKEVMETEITNPEIAGKAIALMKHFEANGDVESAKIVWEKLSKELTKAGQFISLAAAWGESGKSRFSKAVDGFVEKLTGKPLEKEMRDKILGMFDKVQKLEGAEKARAMDELNDYIAKQTPLKFSEKFDQYRYENMLSGPLTHARNIHTGVLSAYLLYPTNLAIRGLLKQSDSYIVADPLVAGRDHVAVEVKLSDAPDYMKTMFSNLGASWRAAKETFSTRHFDPLKNTDIPLEETGKFEEGFEKARRATFPKWYSFNSRLMDAQDAFIRHQIMVGEQARLEAHGVDAKTAQREALNLANKYIGRESLDPNDPQRLHFVRAIDALGVALNKARKIPYLGKGLIKYTIPFVSFPIKWASLNMESSILGLTEMGVRKGLELNRERKAILALDDAVSDIQDQAIIDDIIDAVHDRNFDALRKSKVLPNDLISEVEKIRGPRLDFGSEKVVRAMIGSAITAYSSYLASNGGTEWLPPRDEEGKRLFYQSGRVPFSVRIPAPDGKDVWVPLYYLGPFGLSVALAAALKYYTVDRDEAYSDSATENIARATLGVGDFILNSTPFQGLSDMIDVLDGRKTFAAGAGGLALQFMPFSSMMRYVAQWVDPVYRETDTLKETGAANIPFLSKDLRAKRDFSGKVVERDLLSHFTPWRIGFDDPTAGKVLENFREMRRRDKKMDADTKKMMKMLEERTQTQ